MVDLSIAMRMFTWGYLAMAMGWFHIPRARLLDFVSHPMSHLGGKSADAWHGPSKTPAADGRIWMNIPYMGYMMISVYNCICIYIYVYREREEIQVCVYYTWNSHQSPSTSEFPYLSDDVSDGFFRSRGSMIRSRLLIPARVHPQNTQDTLMW